MSAVLFPLDWEAQGRLVYIPLGGGRGQWQTAHNSLHAIALVTAHNAASAEWRRMYYELEDRRFNDCLDRMAQRDPSDDPYPRDHTLAASFAVMTPRPLRGRRTTMDEMMASVTNLIAENDRLRGGIDLIADERNRLAKRVADLESYMRLIMHRCNIPAKPGQVCHENPADIARQALGGES